MARGQSPGRVDAGWRDFVQARWSSVVVDGQQDVAPSERKTVSPAWVAAGERLIVCPQGAGLARHHADDRSPQVRGREQASVFPEDAAHAEILGRL